MAPSSPGSQSRRRACRAPHQDATGRATSAAASLRTAGEWCGLGPPAPGQNCQDSGDVGPGIIHAREELETGLPNGAGQPHCGRWCPGVGVLQWQWEPPGSVGTGLGDVRRGLGPWAVQPGQTRISWLGFLHRPHSVQLG